MQDALQAGSPCAHFDREGVSHVLRDQLQALRFCLRASTNLDIGGDESENAVNVILDSIIPCT